MVAAEESEEAEDEPSWEASSSLSEGRGDCIGDAPPGGLAIEKPEELVAVSERFVSASE